MGTFFSKRRLKIAEQIIIVIFFAVLIPMTVSGFVISNINQQSNRAQLRSTAILVANIISEEIDIQKNTENIPENLLETLSDDKRQIYVISDNNLVTSKNYSEEDYKNCIQELPKTLVENKAMISGETKNQLSVYLK